MRTRRFRNVSQRPNPIPFPDRPPNLIAGGGQAEGHVSDSAQRLADRIVEIGEVHGQQAGVEAFRLIVAALRNLPPGSRLV